MARQCGGTDHKRWKWNDISSTCGLCVHVYVCACVCVCACVTKLMIHACRSIRLSSTIPSFFPVPPFLPPFSQFCFPSNQRFLTYDDIIPLPPGMTLVYLIPHPAMSLPHISPNYVITSYLTQLCHYLISHLAMSLPHISPSYVIISYLT